MRSIISRPKINQLWLALAGTSSIVIIGAYALAQQSTRSSANDLPKTMSQLVSHQLSDGTDPADAVPKDKSQLGLDTIPFVIITDASKTVVASSAELGTAKPLPPAGTFSYVDKHSEDTFTWQPKVGVRLATHMISMGNGDSKKYIITGQSLSEFEKRIDEFGRLALVIWIFSIVWITFALSLSTKK